MTLVFCHSSNSMIHTRQLNSRYAQIYCKISVFFFACFFWRCVVCLLYFCCILFINENLSVFQPVSQYPQCINDISFWLPEDYEENDFYALVRDIGGNIIEQVYIIDDYFHPKKKQRSHCYRIVYRHLEKTLSQKEVNDIHLQIEAAVVKQLGGEIR